MSSLEKQILKLNDKYIKLFITEIMNNTTPMNEDSLMNLWKSVCGNKSTSKSTKPKRKTGYIVFLSEMRSNVSKANPTLKSTEIVSKVAALWRALSDEDKKIYNEKAKNPQKETRGETRGETSNETSNEARGEASNEARDEARDEVRDEARGEASNEARDDNDNESDDEERLIYEEDTPIEKMTIKQLRNVCEKYKLFTVGKKQDLVERLKSYRDSCKN